MTGFAPETGLRGIVASPRGRVVRLSFHYYNDEPDVHRLLDALREYRCG